MPEANEIPEVQVRGANEPTVVVRLADPRPFFDEKSFTVEVQSNGLAAKIDSVTITPWDNPQFDEFFAQLAADYTGWDATRSWHSNHLNIDAQFQAGGHVALTWTLQAHYFTEDRWQVRITTVIEAGEQMTNLAADIRHFLQADHRP